MQISSTGYVNIQHDLLGLVKIIGVATGQKRTRADGEIEAEFLCINPGSNCEKVWAVKSQLS